MKRITILTVALGLSLAVTAIIAGCGQKSGDAAAGNGAGPGGMRGGMRDMRRGPALETAVATVKPIQLEKEYVGELQPFYSVDLKSTGSGWLRTIRVNTGDRVGKNAVIGEVENDDLQAQVEQGKANIAISKASVDKAQAELERVRNDAQRSVALHDKGLISTQESEQSQTDLKQAKASLDAAKGQFDQYEAQLKATQVKLRDSTLKAPFNGVVAQRYVDPGAYVSPSNPILRLEDNSRVKAVINIVEEDFSSFRKGVVASVKVDSYPGKVFAGRILRIAPSMEKMSRTSAVEILVPNGDGKLMGGMTARVTIVLRENPAALVVPENAVRKDIEKGVSFVYAVEKGMATRRDVTTGIESTGETEITGGLKAGDSVILGGARVHEGMPVGRPGPGGSGRGMRGNWKGGRGQ